MRRLVILFSLLFLTDCYARPEVAWWVDANFNADCRQKDVIKINNDGVCYVVLDQKIIESYKGGNYFDLVELHALLRTKFVDKQGVNHYYLVAIYDDAKIGSGRAVIISKDIGFKKIEKIERRSGISGFSALINNNKKSLIWTFCLYCEDYSTIETSVPSLDKLDE